MAKETDRIITETLTKRLINEEDIEHDIHVKMKPISKKTFHSIEEIEKEFFPRSSEENRRKYPIIMRVSEEERDMVMQSRGGYRFKKLKRKLK